MDIQELFHSGEHAVWRTVRIRLGTSLTPSLSIIRKIITLIFGALLAINAQAQPRPLRIAANLPLSGDLAAFGAPVKDGVEFARYEMKIQKHQTPPLEFDWQDNQGLPRTAVSIARAQLLSEPDVYLSGIRPQTMALWNKLVNASIPHFVWIFDYSIQQNTGKNFRTWVSFKPEIPLFDHYAKEQDAKKIAIVYVDMPNVEDAYATRLVSLLRSRPLDNLYTYSSRQRTNRFKRYSRQA